MNEQHNIKFVLQSLTSNAQLLLKEINKDDPVESIVLLCQSQFHDCLDQLDSWLEENISSVDTYSHDLITKIVFQKHFLKTKVIQFVNANTFKSLTSLRQNQLLLYKIYIHRALSCVSQIYLTTNFIFVQQMMKELFSLLRSFLTKSFIDIGNPFDHLQSMRDIYQQELFQMLRDDTEENSKEILKEFPFNPTELKRSFSQSSHNELYQKTIELYTSINSFSSILNFVFPQNHHRDFKYNNLISVLIDLLHYFHQRNDDYVFKVFLDFVMDVIKVHNCIPNRSHSSFSDTILKSESINIPIDFHPLGEDEYFVDVVLQQEQLTTFFNDFYRLMEETKISLQKADKLKISSLLSVADEFSLIINNIPQSDMEVLSWASFRIQKLWSILLDSIKSEKIQITIVTFKRMNLIIAVINQFCRLLLPKEFQGYEIDRLQTEANDAFKSYIKKEGSKKDFIALHMNLQTQLSRVISQSIWKGRDEELVHGVIDLNIIKTELESKEHQQDYQTLALNYDVSLKKFIAACEERKKNDQSIILIIETINDTQISSESFEKLEECINATLPLAQFVLTELVDCFDYVSGTAVHFSKVMLSLLSNIFQKMQKYRGYSISEYLNQCISFAIGTISKIIPHNCIGEDIMQKIMLIKQEASTLAENTQRKTDNSSLTESLTIACDIEIELYKLTIAFGSAFQSTFQHFSISQRVNFEIFNCCNFVCNFCSNFFIQQPNTLQFHFKSLEEDFNNIAILVDAVSKGNNNAYRSNIMTLPQVFDKFSEVILPLIELTKIQMI
ncbi:hypothetical protein QTN25_008389 [Entamoeba marina]